MNSGILQDIWLGFVGQFRRNPLGVLLLWGGLIVATVAVAVGFGIADWAYSGQRARLPGELDRLYYLTASRSLPKGAGGSMQALTWKGFSPTLLDRLLREGLITGYFHEVRDRPLTIETPRTERTRTVMVDLTLFRGKVPLYAGRAADALAGAEGDGGVAANRALAARPGGPLLGDTIVLLPGDRRPLVAYVGPGAAVDRRPTLLAPDTAVDRGNAGINEVGVYLTPGTGPEGLRDRLNAWLLPEHPGLIVNMTSGNEQHGEALREAAAVAAMASGTALLLALVAFINAGSFVSLWIMNRTQGLALRRTLGAAPRVITLYIISDLLLITASALLTGLGMLFAANRLWFQPNQIRVLTAGSIAAACLIMVAGSALMGLLLTRMVSQREPGTMLGRGF